MDTELDSLLARLRRRDRADVRLHDFDGRLLERLAALESMSARARLGLSFQAAAVTVAFVLGLAFGVGSPSGPPSAPSLLMDAMDP